MRFVPRLAFLLALLATSGCASVTASGGRAQCNGELDPRETEIDDLFDVDGDGFVDGGNPECQQSYAPEELDCNDSNADVFPGNAETTCNDIDDDCDATTLDVIDEDGDGYSLCDEDCDDGNELVAPGFAEVECDDLDNDCDTETPDSRDIDMDGYTSCEDCVDTEEDINPGATEEICDGADNDCDPSTVDGNDVDMDGSSDCFDCDDFDPFVYPGRPEICDDDIDQNCDGVDADCAEDGWAGTWSVPLTSYSCGGGNVTVNFNTVVIQDNSPNLTFVFVGGTHPGSMTGTVDGSNNFSASASPGGACSTSFSFVGGFLTDDSFAATLTATLSSCTGCTDQTWNLTGTR